jgi:hypothetical protein
MMRYATMIEKAEGNSSAHGPGFSGGVATLAALPEVERGLATLSVFM